MLLPGGLHTVIVSGSFVDATGEPLRGKVTFCPTAPVSDAAGGVVIDGVRSFHLNAGSFTSTPLVATDNGGLLPAGWLYVTEVSLEDSQPVTYDLAIPHTPSPVSLAALIEAA